MFSWAYVKVVRVLSSSVPFSCLWGFGAIPKVSFGLKLRHCTSIFSTLFPPCSLPKVRNVSCRRQSVAPVHLLDDGSNSGRRVRLTRKTRPVALAFHNPDPGHSTPRRWKRLRAPSSEGEGSAVACLAIFFIALRLGEVCTGDAWNLPSEGTGVGFFRLLSPAEETCALALVHFNSLHPCARMDRHTRTPPTHNPPTHTHHHHQVSKHMRFLHVSCVSFA